MNENKQLCDQLSVKSVSYRAEPRIGSMFVGDAYPS